MAYPIATIGEGSEEILNSDQVVERSVSGKVRARSLSDNVFRTFKIVHDALTNVQKTAIDSDYIANKGNTFSYTWPISGLTYTVMYGGPPSFKALGGTYWATEVILEQVA